MLELLVTHACDRGLEELRRARQREQQPGYEDEAAVAHLPEGGEQLGLRLRVGRGGEPLARVLYDHAHHLLEQLAQLRRSPCRSVRRVARRGIRSPACS